MNGAPDTYFFEDRAGTGGADLKLLARLGAYLRPHKGLIARAVAGLVLGAACQLAGPYIVKIVIDRYLAAGRSEGLPAWVGLYLLAAVGGMGFLYLQMYSVSVLGQKVILAIRTEAFRKLQRLPVATFDRTPTGRLMTRLTSDVEALQELIASGLVSAAGDFAILLGTAGVLLFMNARLALIAFAVLPLLVLFVEVLKNLIRAANRESRRMLARLNAFLQEQVSGVAVLKAFVAEGKAQARFDALNGDYAAMSIRLTNFYSVYFPGVELLASVATALLLWRGGRDVIGGAVTFGTLVAFLEYAQKFYNPIKDISDKYNILQTALVACERIFQVLDEEAAPGYGPEGGKEAEPAARRAGGSAPPPAVEFRDVWFSYGPRGAAGGRPGGGEAGAPVLRGVSFSLAEGETGAIVGPTGAGKTTLLHLLCRLYEISRGKILLFGRDIREMPREELRGMISLVLQEPFLFTGTILDNVRAGGAGVERAVDATGVAAFAAGWEGGLKTPVGERGSRLSVGQRQLVAFARAVARDPRLLVLDEATSSVDPVTEHQLQTALANILSGRTSLVVAHRLSTVLSAHRIFVMHRGKIREVGTHEELLAARGIYHRLFTLQFAGKQDG